MLGGEPRLIARGGRNPRFSPDGSHIAFVTGMGGIGGVQGGELFVIPSTGGARQLLAPQPPGAASPVWSPDGKFILFAIGDYRPFDWGIVAADAGPQVQATVLPLADIKKRHGLADLLPHGWTAGNRILFSARSGDSAHVFEIGLSPPGLMSKSWRLDEFPKRLTAGTELEERPTLAAGGAATGPRRLAFASLVRSENLWSLELVTNHPRTGGNLKRLTQGGGFHIFPSVSRDGTKLAFISHAAYNDEVWLFDLKTGKRLLLSSNVSPKFKTVIHADGSRVIYDASGATFAVPTSGGTPEKVCERCGWTWD